MTLVKITKEQAAAIQEQLGAGKTKQQILTSHSCKHADPAIQDIEFDQLAIALYIGYEVIADPAEVLEVLTADLKKFKEHIDERVDYFCGDQSTWGSAKYGSYVRVQVLLQNIMQKAGI